MPIDWNAVTGIGTLAVAASAVGVAVWSDWRSGKRVDSERVHSEKQLTDERARSDEKISDERRLALEREQFAEASRVEVVLTVPKAGAPANETAKPTETPKLRLIIRNRGNYAITKVWAWAALKMPDNYQALEMGKARQEQREDSSSPYVEPVPGAHPAWLPPWDARLVFERDLPEELQGYGEDLPAYPIALWTDRWGTSWEHKRGKLRQVESSRAFNFDAGELFNFDEYGAGDR